QPHEHVESERDDRGGPAREKGGGAGARPSRLGEDEPGAGFQGRDRISSAGRTAKLPGPVGLQPGGLRVHDVHRQQRSVARRGVGRDRHSRTRGRGGTPRQPQLRGANPVAGSGQLPTLSPAPLPDIAGAGALTVLGESITTDHISPAESIKRDSPAGTYLVEHGVPPADFNSYGARRGNHEVMMRGTFANIRLRNLLAPGTEGGWKTSLPSGEVRTIYDAAMSYKASGVALVGFAGNEYGTGSSRD